MPTKKTVTFSNSVKVKGPSKPPITKEGYLLLLRKEEVIAYHHVCRAFRAQGHLTPEKLKFLKEIAAALYIPENRHKAECLTVVNDDELEEIANSVAGPNTDLEWYREGKDDDLLLQDDSPVPSAYLHMADIVAEIMREARAELEGCDDETEIIKKINLKYRCSEAAANKPKITKPAGPKKKILKKIKKEEKDGESSALVSSTTDLVESQPTEEDKKNEEMLKTDKDPDTILMPPPPTVANVPVSLSEASLPPATSPAVTTVPPTPVITIPPPPSMTVIPVTSTLTVSSTADPSPLSPQPTVLSSPLVPNEIQLPVFEKPILSESEEIEFFSFPEALDPSLPPLVVVPPSEPVITVPHSSSFSPPAPSPSTLVLPSGMSIQLRDDVETKSRKRSLTSQDIPNSTPPPAKTMAFSQITKMTPIMVSSGGVTGQGQVKVTPIMTRAVTQSTLPSSAQKVIIVSNSSAVNSPMIQRSLGVPGSCSMAMPVVRAHQPRLQPATGLVQSCVGGATAAARLRPKLVTVPKSRTKGSPLLIPNLQLKNPIALKQDNVTVVDTSLKRMPLVSGPAKILPKPPGMVIVNHTQGNHKMATSVVGPCSAQTQRMISSRVIGQAEGTKPASSKQSVVILQKGGGSHRALALTNTSKDFMQKLMAKKCVVIQSSKTVPKNISPKPPPPSVTTTNAGNVVVLDLSQEQYRQNMSTTTIADILQASGFITSSGVQTGSAKSPQCPATPVSDMAPNSNLLQASQTLSLEEVTLSDQQSESIVTLDQAVELLGDDPGQEDTVGEAQPLPDSSHTIQMAMEDIPEQIFTITPVLSNEQVLLGFNDTVWCPEELAAGDITFVTDHPETVALTTNLPNQISALTEGATAFPLHGEGAVTIQHSNIDMPSNMCLEEYSSQQMENQSLN